MTGWTKFYDEAFGETGIHAYLRTLDYSVDGIAARLAAFDLFARRCRLDASAYMFEEAFVPPRNATTRVYSEQDVANGMAQAATMLSIIVARMVAATGPNLPQRFQGANTARGHATDHWSIPAIVGSARAAERFPGFALFYPSGPCRAMGQKSTLLCDSPLCRDGIAVIKFTKLRKMPRHCFTFCCFRQFQHDPRQLLRAS